ncbi:MAG TPA: hypothetical protein VHH12_14280 [Mycobacterium sp.]|nr:hypothetical protein [Mycobacterium sp.]
MKTVARINLLIASAVVTMTLGLAACGTTSSDDAEAPGSGAGDIPTDAAAGICTQDEPDCVDTPQLTEDEPVPIDETGIEQFRRDTQFYLGKRQDELPEHIRVARINDEHRSLTEDYQLGRITVELDDAGGDGPVVTSATVELPDGPETFTHAP